MALGKEGGEIKMEIKAGVTLMQDFCRPGADEFQGYIDYLDREEVQRNHAIQTFNLFNDYMGNPEKSTGLFTDGKDSLSYEEKRELKAVFETAQKNDSIMWQTVISFDNHWLEKNHIYDSKNGMIDEQKLKSVTRFAVGKLLESEGLTHAVWSAGIHYNTDNIHIHVATVEPFPIREKMTYKGKEEVRGKFKLKNLEACKSVVVNEIMQTKELNLLLNKIIRKDIVQSMKERQLAEDPFIRKQFLKLYESLPDIRRNLFQYNNNVMKPYREQIDSISRTYIEKYHSKEYEEFKEILSRQSELYTEAYGKGQSNRDYIKGKEADLMQRMGNAVLQAVKDYEGSLQRKVKQQEPNLAPESLLEDPFVEPENGSEEINYEEISYGEVEIQEDAFENFSLELNRKTEDTRPELGEEFKKAQEYMEAWQDREIQRRGEQETGRVGYAGRGKRKRSPLEETYGHYLEELKVIRASLNPEKGESIDKETVQKKLKAGIENRNPLVLHLAGELHERGRIVELNMEKSHDYFRESLLCFKTDEPKLPDERDGNFSFQAYLQYRIGKQYDRGWGTEQDKKTAAGWLEKSDTDYARYSLGNLYYRGEGVEQSYPHALKLYSSVDGFPFAGLKLAEMYRKGQGTEAEPVKSEKYYRKAFEGFESMENKQPDELAEYQLGKMLFYGRGTEKNITEAIKYLEMASEKKNIPAQYLVSSIYLKEGIEEKIPQAIETLTELAEKGNHSLAQYALGKMYTDPENTLYEMEKGIHYLEQAAGQDHEYAQYSIGKIYTNPELGHYDLKEGIRYLVQSAEKENEYARYQLGKLFLDWTLDIYDSEQGMSYLEEAASQGNELAKFRLIKEYMDKNSETYNLHQGLNYLRELADMGNEYAQYQLGKLYLDREMELYDSEKAVYYLKEASAQGNEPAKFRLGKEYLDKNSEAYNPSQGLEYMEALAVKGNQYAQVKMGFEYLKAEHVERNVNKAAEWFGEAARQGNELAQDMLHDLSEAPLKQKFGGPLNELDRALVALRRSMHQAERETLKNIREYEIELEWEIGNGI